MSDITLYWVDLDLLLTYMQMQDQITHEQTSPFGQCSELTQRQPP